jgi:gliding motility-associated-like protein
MVQIVSPPDAGNDATTSICSNADPQDLFLLLGANAQPGGTWSPALASGTGVFNPSVDVSGIYAYTVGNVAGCADDSATVSITVIPGPDAGQNGSITLCINSAPQDLFNALGGNPTPGGIWSPPMASGTGVFDPSVDTAGVYVYTLTGTSPCANDSAVVAVNINTIPDAGTDGSVSLCTSSAPQDLFNALGGTPMPGGTWSPALASGTGVFTPGVDPAGTYTYSVGGGFCTTATANVVVSVAQAPNAGALGMPLSATLCPDVTILDLNSLLNGSQDAGTWNDDDATGALSGNIFNATAVNPGIYHFTYTVPSNSPDCPPATATVTATVSPNAFAGVYDGAQPVCSSAGTIDLNDLLINEQPGGVWTDASNTPVANPISLSGYAAGTYVFTYTITNPCGSDSESAPLTILAGPSLGVSNITGTSAICQGNSLPILLTGMTDGTYTVTYDLSGANTASGLTAAITVTGGNATLTVPASALVNTGTTIISFTLIQNTATNCSASLANVQATLTVNPGSNLESANLSAANTCKGSDVIVIISGATGMPDGTYHFNYNIPGATPASGTTPDAAITVGSGQFTLPASLFPIAGNYTATITSIVATGNVCSNASEDAAVSFTVLPTPDVSGAQVAVASTCISFGTQVTISGAANLPDGDYVIDYILAGSNTAAASAQVTFAAGSGTFSIPAAQLANQGSTTLTILTLAPVSLLCGTAPNSFNVVTFDVVEPGTPSLLAQGNEFCGADHPTIATLSANITGGGNLVWYDAAAGGNVVTADTPLVNGTTYYATFSAGSGCESPVRLAVTVDLTKCNDILIPDGFSPNHDGINDAFEIVNLRDLYPKFHIEIYNRYGNILYKGNINTDDWDGTDHEGGLKMGNNVLPVGVYFYILEFNDGARQPVQGRVYLGR